MNRELTTTREEKGKTQTTQGLKNKRRTRRKKDEEDRETTDKGRRKTRYANHQKSSLKCDENEEFENHFRFVRKFSIYSQFS